MKFCLTPSENDHVQWDEYNLKETNNQASKCLKKMLRQGRISPESKWERKYLKACRKRGIAKC